MYPNRPDPYWSPAGVALANEQVMPDAQGLALVRRVRGEDVLDGRLVRRYPEW